MDPKFADVLKDQEAEVVEYLETRSINSLLDQHFLELALEVLSAPPVSWRRGVILDTLLRASDDALRARSARQHVKEFK